MNGWLRLAAYLYGSDAVHRVFEPLVADAQGEIRASRTPALARLYWQLAMMRALLGYSPRMMAVPGPLLCDLVVRSAVFGGLAVALLTAFSSLGSSGVPASFANTLPFIVMPIVWRIRVSALPHHQRRSLAVLIATASAIGVASLTPGSLATRLALAIMPLFVAFAGWRSGDPEYAAESAIARSILVRGLVLGSMFQVAAWIPTMVLEDNVVAGYWPGKTLFAYLIGLAISASIIKRWHVQGA